MREADSKHLNRMAASSETRKLFKDNYFKPQVSTFRVVKVFLA